MDNELLLSLYNDTAEQIRNSQQWQSFLNTAAFNYKRSFQEQILLFAQKPGAAAVLSEKQWKAKYGRNVQKDKAIYLFAFQDGMDKVISVYDITDTTSGNESNTVPIFYFGETQEHMAASVAALNNRYEINESGLESAIFTAVDIMTEEQLEIILPELLEIIKGTPASNFKSSLLRQKLIRLIANSAAYMCHLRCNMPVANSFSYANFRDIALFSPQAIITIGSAMSRVSFEIMQTIIRANMQVDRKIYKNSNRTFEKNTSTLYNQDVNETTPITEREADENDTRLFRQTETELHQGIQTDSLQRSDGTLQNGGTSAGNPNTGKQPVGKFNQAESDFMGNHRGAESSRSGEMDWLNDQSAGNNANAGSRNDSSQLNKEKTTKTAGLAKTLPLFLSLEQVDEVLRQGSLFSQGKYRIFEQFQKESSVQKNADFLKDEYGIGGRYVANALSINYDNKGLEIIEPDSDNKYLLSWNIVAKEIARLINENSYLSTDEAVDYTKYLQERKEREIRSNIADDYCNLVRLYNDQTEEKLNQYALTIGCANEFTAGNDTTNLLNNAGDNIYTLIYASLDTIEQNRLFAEKAKSLKKAFEPYRTDITEAIQKKIQYKYTAGDIAFIGTKRYEIVSVDTNVTLSDISFPLLQETYSVEDFEMELRKNPLNAYLQVSVEKPKLTPEEVAELLPIDGNEILQKYENYFSDDKFFIEADGTLTWIYFNPDSADGGQFVATTISANDVLTANNGAHGYKEFFENLAENKKMILIDVTSSDFRDCAKSFLLDKADIVGYSAEAVEQLVEFAKSNSKKHLPKIEDKITACITYSEHPLFVDETGNKRYRDLSFPLMNKLLGTLNAKHHHERELVPEYDIDWYYKMGFSVDAVINGEKFTYSGRMDIGDDEFDVIGLIEEECKNTLKSDYLQEIRKTDEEHYQCMHKDLINIRELLVPFMKSHSSLTAADEEKFGEIMEIENSRFSLSEPAKEKISSSATYPTETKKDVILENYRKIKKENPFNIVFYQVGDFYEVIGDDAKTIADALNLVLTSRDVDDSQHIPMCGIPAHRLEEYLKKLQPLDYRVVVSSVENGNRKDFYLIPENTSEPTTENSEIQRAIRLINKYKKEEFGYEDGEDYKDLTSIGLAYTTTEDDQHEIQAEVDLVNFTMRQLVDNNVVMTVQYDSLNELIKNELEVISFDDLVFLEDEAYQKVYGVDRDADDFEHALIGQEIELEGSTFVIESISKDNVFMRDTDFRKHTEYPVSRVEKLDFIRTVFEETPSSAANYHITDNNIGAGKPRERFRNNMNAIKTLHHIENENRTATQEEQDILSQYVGWGGLQEAFDENNGSWSEEFKELKAELSQEEYNAARSSTLTAFYTPPTVIRGIYKALGNMGFKTGNILDPACGIGHFFGMLPETMRQSQLYGTEIDSVSGKIAQQLYPNASIKVQGFENSTTPDNFFDVVVGNVPFGPFKVYDPKYNKYKFLIHDYFFAKAIDQTRPGGVIAFITSNGAGGGTMDKRDNRVRKHIAERCEFLGAIRLPDNTFSKSAGTEISTDIIFLQKRERAKSLKNIWKK